MGVEDLVKEYRKSLSLVRRAKEKAKTKSDREYLSAMESDLKWCLEWMTTGRQPEARRGIERRAAYERERPIDPIHFQRYVMHPLYESDQTFPVSDEDMRRIRRALSVLTKLEREAYLLKVGQCFSYSEVAMLMGVKKGTVQKMIQRAEKKMRRLYINHLA